MRFGRADAATVGCDGGSCAWYGGVSVVARAVGLTRPTITAGMKELGDARQRVPMATRMRGCAQRWRRGWSRPPRPSDVSPLRWTCKSVRTLPAELSRQGHPVSHQTVSEVVQHLGYSLQVNRKTREGALWNPGNRDRFKY
jgi:DNA-binding phage protein